MNLPEAMKRLRELDREIRHLGSIVQLLSWDQETGMPSGAVAGRAEQLSLLEGMIHDRIAGKEMAELLETCKDAPGDENGAALLRVLEREHARAAFIPRRLVTEFAREVSKSQAAWVSARKKNDFAAFRPHLESLLALSREKADAIGFEEERYDALLDEYEPWMKSSTVDRLFEEMSAFLVPLLKKISEAPRIDDRVLYRDFPVEKQKLFSRQVAEKLGYDFERGNISESAHPFTIRPGDVDVRITTRYDASAFKTAIFGTIHETGHALYEQGVAASLAGTALGQGTSLGIHESQSRTWENMIGRSRPFWVHFYPELVKLFPENLGDFPLDQFVRAVNKVEPSLIRIEADEVSYGLHIILRYRLERRLISGDLFPSDLPEAWNEQSEALLGIRPGKDAEGVLQDVHWSMGAFGYFPTYALGNLYGAQFFNALQKELPNLDASLSSGQFKPLLELLTEKIYRHGSALTAEELVLGVTGEELSAKYFAHYLQEKYTELYGL
jgi:carboxypeptidase Taq